MTKTEIARSYVEKYIDIALTHKVQFSKHKIAEIIFTDNPHVFKDKEDARFFVRGCLNTAGRRSKSKEEISKMFALIPEAIREVETTEPFVVPSGIKKCLMIADVHGRFYNRNALEIAINYAIKERCDSVIIDGDFLDQYQYSRFDKNPSVSAIFEEQEWGQDVLELLQKTFGYVVYKAGNHCIRREKTIEKLSASMPELMEYSKLSNYLFYDGCAVNFVEDYRFVKYGKLNIIHGHEIYGGSGIHVAHNRFMKTLDNTLSAHSHKAQSIIKSNINGDIYGSWALGCLCGLNPRYSPMNDWNNGFAVVEKDSDGNFDVNNRIILGNKTVNA